MAMLADKSSCFLIGSSFQEISLSKSDRSCSSLRERPQRYSLTKGKPFGLTIRFYNFKPTEKGL